MQGRSWSGYWAAKLAITEGEYLYDYLQAKCAMLGARDLDDMLARARRFSLLDAGLLDRPSAPMLAVNGARDSQIPISDLYLLLEHGDAREAWVNPRGGHMGRSPD